MSEFKMKSIETLKEAIADFTDPLRKEEFYKRSNVEKTGFTEMCLGNHCRAAYHDLIYQLKKKAFDTKLEEFQKEVEWLEGLIKEKEGD